MKVLSVNCNHCGAPLEVPHKTRFLTCSYCESRLEVQRSGTAYYTNVLEAVGEIREDVETIKLQNELERVDREWQMEREGLLVTDKYGRAHRPTVWSGYFTILVGVVGGIVFLSVAPGGISGFGIVFVVVGVLIGISTLGRAQKYDRRKSTYESRRSRISAELRRR